jgi:transposase InsO family protein
VRTTDSRHSLATAPNVLDRHFEAVAPNRVWLADITYVATDEGWLYVALVLDLFSRRLVGWAMRAAIDTELTAEALAVALACASLRQACCTTPTGACSIAPTPTARPWRATASRCR